MSLIRTAEDYNDLLDDLHALSPEDSLAIDTETTGLHIYQDDHLLGISLTFVNREGQRVSHYVSVAHEDSDIFPAAPVIEAIVAHQGQHEYHHAIFDWRVLAKAYPQFELPRKFWDAQVVDWLMDENLDHRLKEGVGARLFGADAKGEKKALQAVMRGRTQSDVYKELRATEEWGKPHPANPAREEARRIVAASKKTYATLTAEDIAEYAMLDTALTYDIVRHQEAEVADPRDPELSVVPDIEREFRFQRVVYRMIDTGIRVDPEQAEHHRAKALGRLAEIEAALPSNVNFASPAQLGKLLYWDWKLKAPYRTASGAPSTDKKSLEELEGQHPGIELILEHRHLSKAVGTYYDGLLDRIGTDGRIHSSFNSARTVTGRFSSSDPNLQNIPRADTNPEVRSVFVPEPGTELWEFDLSQAELRVMAGWANETRMIDAILAGRDLHGETAAAMWGPDYTTLQRRLAKNLNFGYPYGIRPRKFATYLVAGTGRPITQAIIDQSAEILAGYERAYPNLNQLMSGLALEAEKLGYIPLHVPGRFRRYRGPGYFHSDYYTALNNIVQGGVAEFLKDVMMELDGEIGRVGRVCLQIHDSLVIELEPESAPQVHFLLQRIADDINPFKMPMRWDAKQWGEHE